MMPWRLFTRASFYPATRFPRQFTVMKVVVYRQESKGCIRNPSPMAKVPDREDNSTAVADHPAGIDIEAHFTHGEVGLVEKPGSKRDEAAGIGKV